jgi:predicted SPOUT superfamily RNA methylase MTH1
MLIRLQMAVHLFITRSRVKDKKNTKRKVLFISTVKKGVSYFRVQVVHLNDQ